MARQSTSHATSRPTTVSSDGSSGGDNGAKTKSAKRTKSPSCVAEFPLRTTPADEAEMQTRIEAARHIFNAVLGESLRRLKLMRESRDWQRARAMPKSLGKDPSGKPIANRERTDLFKACIARFAFTSASLQKFAEACRDGCWIGRHLGSHDTQTTSLRAFQSIQQYAFGKRGRPRFKGKHRLRSVEGKGDAVIRFRIQGTTPVVLWRDLTMPLLLDPRDRDGWQAEMLARRVKYVRIIRREIGERSRWYAQLVVEGHPPRKARHPPGKGNVGLDIGPSTVAIVGEQSAALVPFCPQVGDIDRQTRLLRRALDRSRRATNPHAFTSNGTFRKGARITRRSAGYRRLAQRLAEMERRLAAERRRAHGELANQVLAEGDTAKMEKLSYRSFQKNFGRSVKRRAPGLFVSLLKRKAESAGATVIEFPTRTTRLSQYDHKTGTYAKKPLSQRWHVFADGTEVQRDLYSAWLARFVEGDRLDASRVREHWAVAEPRLGRAASRPGCQAASGRGSPPSHVEALNGLRVRAARSSKREGCTRPPSSAPQQAGSPNLST